MKLNEVYHLIIYCLNCIRRDQNSTYKTGLTIIDLNEFVLAVVVACRPTSYRYLLTGVDGSCNSYLRQTAISHQLQCTRINSH
jgi:hypothetical protein